MVPFALKSFFGFHPESCRFLIYRARSLLLTPPCQTTGDGPTRANAFWFIAAVDAFGSIAQLGCVRCAATAAEVARVRIARLTRMRLAIVSSSETERCPAARETAPERFRSNRSKS